MKTVRIDVPEEILDAAIKILDPRCRQGFSQVEWQVVADKVVKELRLARLKAEGMNSSDICVGGMYKLRWGGEPRRGRIIREDLNGQRQRTFVVELLTEDGDRHSTVGGYRVRDFVCLWSEWEKVVNG